MLRDVFSGRFLALALSTLSATAVAFIDQQQGTQLHGTEKYENVNISLAEHNRTPAGAPPCRFTFSRGELQPVCGPLLGAIFRAPYKGGIARFEIQDVRPHTSVVPAGSSVLVPSGLSEYKVVVTSKPGGSSPLCGKDSNGYALAVPGAWSSSGELLNTDGYFTFACVPGTDKSGAPVGGGTIAKCVDWGYPPWAEPTVVWATSALDPTLTSYSEPVARRFHQTCVRLATADYCGEGFSNTIDNTPVRVADVVRLEGEGLARRDGAGRVSLATAPTFTPLAGDRALLEGVWGFDKCGRARVLCLSKARWDTLSLAATCVDGVMALRMTTAPSYVTRSCARAMAAQTDHDRLSYATGGPGKGRPKDFRPLSTPAAARQIFRCAEDRKVYKTRQDCSKWCGSCREELLQEAMVELRPQATENCEAAQPPKICDEWTDEDFQREEATLFSYSNMWDRAFVSFVDSTNGNRVTTSAVVHDFPPAPPFSDDSFGFKVAPGGPSGAFNEVMYEGRIFAASLPGALQSKMGVIPLFRCKEKTGPRYLITTSSTCSTGPGPAAYDPQGKEGYIYPPSPAPEPDLESAPLFLFKQTGGGGFATSTVRPDGYDEGSKVLLGHLPMRSRLGYRFH